MARFEPNYRHKRNIADVDKDWLDAYLLRHYERNDKVGCVDLNLLTHYQFGDVDEGMGWVAEYMGNDQWRKMRAAWRKHKQRDTYDNKHLQFQQRFFVKKCRELDIDPAMAMRILTGNMVVDNAVIVKRGIAAMEKIDEIINYED